MDVFLMQHGEAVAAEVDPDRPLAEAGRISVGAVARHAAACGVRIDRILHSDKLRAVQTADLLAEALGCPDVRMAPGMHPNDDVRTLVATLLEPAGPGAVALVGHLPFLDRMASLLVVGDPSGHVVSFRNGGLVKLVPSPSGSGFVVAWAITPEVARG